MGYPEFTPDVRQEHEDDGRDLDSEIVGGQMDPDDDSPRMLHPEDTYAESLGNAEIMGQQDAILSTVARSRDNRRPCPPMKAVDVDAPFEPDHLGAAVESTPGVYPITVSLIEKYRKAGTPRIVRVDTEADYQAFRTLNSPERTALLQKLTELEDKIHAHIADPSAHDDVEEEAASAEALGAEVEAIEADKQIPLRMPAHFDGLMEQWHEGGMAGSTMILPHPDGGRWFATASEAVKKGELETAKAAAEAGVPATAIVGYLPAIGASLAGADAMKALASGAMGPGSILERPEAKGHASFMVRLDPQASPAIFALGELACLCQAGNQRACDEWNQLAAAAPAPVRQVMGEILAALKPQTAIGGAVEAMSSFFGGLWHRLCGLFGGEHSAQKALPPHVGLQAYGSDGTPYTGPATGLPPGVMPQHARHRHHRHMTAHHNDGPRMHRGAEIPGGLPSGLHPSDGPQMVPN